MVLAVWMITKRHVAAVVFLATLITSAARADGPDISARRLLLGSESIALRPISKGLRS